MKSKFYETIHMLKMLAFESNETFPVLTGPLIFQKNSNSGIKILISESLIRLSVLKYSTEVCKPLIKGNCTRGTIKHEADDVTTIGSILHSETS